MPTLIPQQLEDFAVSLLAAGGAHEEEAALVGRSLVHANLRGYDSHGVMRIPYYVDMVQKGDIVPGAELEFLKESPTNLVANAHWGFGRVQAGAVLDRLIAKADQAGIGVGTIHHCSHIGRLGEYAEIAASRNLLSMVMVNTHGAARRVAPPGGVVARLGTNPIALGAPHADTPLILDFSTSATAEGKVRVKSIAGEPCQEGWLIDSEGNPTTVASSLYGDPPGTILPFGGPQAYKAFGLALMIDVFSGALSGGLCARETPITPNGNCVFMMVLSPEHFGGGEHFARETAQLVDFVRGCPTKKGVDGIVMPGDPERHSAARRSQEGITLDHENWLKLTNLAERLRVTSPSA